MTQSNEILHSHERCLSGKLRRAVRGVKAGSGKGTEGEGGREKERDGDGRKKTEMVVALEIHE